MTSTEPAAAPATDYDLAKARDEFRALCVHAAGSSLHGPATLSNPLIGEGTVDRTLGYVWKFTPAGDRKPAARGWTLSQRDAWMNIARAVRPRHR